MAAGPGAIRDGSAVLRELRLQADQLGPEGVRALATAPWLPSLEQLRLAPSDEIADGLDAWRAAAPTLEITGIRRGAE